MFRPENTRVAPAVTAVRACLSHAGERSAGASSIQITVCAGSSSLSSDRGGCSSTSTRSSFGQSCGGATRPLRFGRVAMDTFPSMAGSSPVSAFSTRPVAPASWKTSLTLPPKLGCS